MFRYQKSEKMVSEHRKFETMSTERLHQEIRGGDLTQDILWVCVKELLTRHQFTSEDLQIFPDAFENYGDEDEEEEENENIFDFYTQDLDEFNGSDRVISGSDLTESDIVWMFRYMRSNELRESDPWAFYVISTRFIAHQDAKNLKYYLSAKIRYGEFDRLAYFANVNSDLAKVVYHKIYTYPDVMAKIQPLLNFRSREIFRNHQGMKLRDLSPNQKRISLPMIPTLKQFSRSFADPKDVAKNKRFIYDL